MQTASLMLQNGATALSTPVADTFATADSGGVLLDSTAYYYRVSAINANGETLAFAEQSQTTGAGGAGNAHTVTVNWLAVTGATGYKVYGRTTGAELLIATVGAVLTYTDDGSITPAGALPTTNTTIAADSQYWHGGEGVFAVKATGYGTVELQMLLPDGVTWFTPTDASLAADGAFIIDLPPGPVRAKVVTATSVYAQLARVPV